jgi:glycosyltransferase involved in cell wall biosynthesis
VVATWWETAEWVAELSVAKGVKAYFIQHHEIHDGQPKERVAATWKLPLHKVTISKWLSDTNQRMYGLGPIPVIHNSVDMEQFHAPARERGDPPTVGLLYSKTYWKGLALSFRAIEIARKQVPDLRVVMFGAHEEVAELPLPKGANLIVRPAQDQIRDIYARCDWWLCGSLAEGFHLPPLEAMACRVPVVSTAVGGPMDIVRDGENGFLSPVGDPEALGANLTRALELSSGDWKVMSDHALGTATDYTWDDATDRFESELQRIVAAGPLDRAI